MDKRIEKFFENEKIEYFGAVGRESIRLINERLLSRYDLNPKSAIIFLLPYYVGDAENLSEYSAARDYHIIISEITTRLVSLLSEIYPDNKFVGFGDHSPIDERFAAVSRGLGIFGENGLIINEKYGTYVFLADVLSDVDPEVLGADPPRPVSKCEGCELCKTSCPTGALSGCGDCLSMITQKKGELTESELDLMVKVGTVWGCDVCQRVCPHNINAQVTPIRFFKDNRITNLTESVLLELEDEEFKKRAFAWRGKKTVLRNVQYYDKHKLKNKNTD